MTCWLCWPTRNRHPHPSLCWVGSNIIPTGDVKPVVLKMEIMGLRLVEETPKAWIVEAGAGEVWHDAVAWTLAHGHPGLGEPWPILGTWGIARPEYWRVRRSCRTVSSRSTPSI